jgi:hypothetical protein
MDLEGRRMIAIPDDLAAPYVNLSLHKVDLNRAREFLVEFDKRGGVPPGLPMDVVYKALWHSALASTMKCFQHSESRTEILDPDRIFGTDTTQPVRAAFDLLKALRNKHVLHDENDWMQTTPYAIVGDAGNNQPTIGVIDCIVTEGTDTAHIGQLRTVVDAACDWITQEIDKHTEAIRADLEARDVKQVVRDAQRTLDRIDASVPTLRSGCATAPGWSGRWSSPT